MKFFVRPVIPSRRGGVTAAFTAILSGALAVAAFGPARAGEAGSSFRVTINVTSPGSAACGGSATGAAGPFACRPTVIGAAAGGDQPRGGAVIAHRPDMPLRLAGEMIELGDENYAAWTDDSNFAWGETTTRRVVAGGVEYVEMTVAW